MIKLYNGIFGPLLAAIVLGGLTPCASASRPKQLNNVVVWGKRPMKDIGVEKTTFDSIALRENISQSMADILTYNSSVFVKSYGRATLSTVAFRGTSPSHTQVTWNGMRINSPMLGMTDFSTIPSFFIDRASLLHGGSSINETGGGLGGLVKLSTSPDDAPGWNVRYIQGIGSFDTFDEFAKVSYGDNRWFFSTRASYASSPNDYKYTNHDKKINIYDDDHNIIGQYYPKERNKSGAYKDLHILQEAYYKLNNGDRIGLNAWYMSSGRELPMLSTDYGDDKDFINKQREHTLRSVISWSHMDNIWKISARAGYIYSDMAYDYKREITDGNWASMTRSRSYTNTYYGQAEADLSLSDKWYLSANIAIHQHDVKSKDKNIILQEGDKAIIGYEKRRMELSTSASARWQPIKPIGLSLVLREEMFGDKWAPAIPAFFVDGLIWPKANMILKASVSRNHKFPTLNDLYFLPGGNPKLKNENGWTYDTGISFSWTNTRSYNDSDTTNGISVDGGLTWFDSHIDDWIIWLPTTKGFFSPRNVKRVHAYGMECRLGGTYSPHHDWVLNLNGSYSWTPSINRGEKMSPADQSVGKQLPYVPKHSASFTGRIDWKSWSLLYKWVFYSERFTMSSNDYSITGHLPKYYMNNISLGKNIAMSKLDLQLKLAVNNLFNEDYISVLSRPMPGINFEFYIGLTPKF